MDHASPLSSAGRQCTIVRKSPEPSQCGCGRSRAIRDHRRQRERLNRWLGRPVGTREPGDSSTVSITKVVDRTEWSITLTEFDEEPVAQLRIVVVEDSTAMCGLTACGITTAQAGS